MNLPLNKGDKTICDITLSNDIVILIDGTPTRFQPPVHPNSAVDLNIVSTNIAAHSSWKVLEDCANSDHFSTVLTISDDNNNILHHSSLTPYRTRNYHKTN